MTDKLIKLFAKHIFPCCNYQMAKTDIELISYHQCKLLKLMTFVLSYINRDTHLLFL